MTACTTPRTPTMMLIHDVSGDAPDWNDLLSTLLTGNNTIHIVVVAASRAPADGQSVPALMGQAPHTTLGETLALLMPPADEQESMPMPVYIEPLTAREQEVLEVLAEGASNQEIAEALVIAPNTVKRHVQTILAKFGVRNRTQAVARAQHLKLLTPPLTKGYSI
jgi:DNA-binding CsgD family transcriptional regulator